MFNSQILIEYFNRDPFYRKLLDNTSFLSKDRRAQYIYTMWIKNDKTEEEKLKNWIKDWEANRVF